MLVCRDVLAGSGEELSAADKIDEWASSNASRSTRSRVVLDDLSSLPAVSVSALAVAVHQLRDLVRVRPS
jgi:glutamate dehydrogenase